MSSRLKRREPEKLEIVPPTLGICSDTMHCQRCKDKNFLITCKCGCGGILRLHDNEDRERCWLVGHCNRKGGRWSADRWAVRRPDHPQADKNGYVLRSRLVYEESHNCCLLPWALIHHRDKNPLNDVWYNLLAVWRGQHNTIHLKGTTKYDHTSRSCIDCGSKTTHIDRTRKTAHWYALGDGKYRCNRCYLERYRVINKCYTSHIPLDYSVSA
jgi:hypothetical protein